MRNRSETMRVPIGIGFGAVLALLGGAAVEVLWNRVAPGAFGLPRIGLPEGLALLGLLGLAGRLLLRGQGRQGVRHGG